MTRVDEFLGAQPLTVWVATVESKLVGAASSEVTSAAQLVDDDLLHAALVIRERFGRISDLVHATSMLLVLPRIVEPGEKILAKPSLAAGNDPLRPFDLETDRRIAEFKLAQWRGADAMRKRDTFKDLVNLALDTSGRRAQLYVRGELPARFLRSSTAQAAWGLGRAPATSRRFQAEFGSLDITIKDFTNRQAVHVEIIDITKVLPTIVDLGR